MTASVFLPNGNAARFFNGDNSYLQASDSDVFSIVKTNLFTWEAWICPSVVDFPKTDGDKRTHFLGKGQGYGTTAEQEYVAVFYNRHNTPQFRPQRISAYCSSLRATSGTLYSTGCYFQGRVEPNEWVHVVGTYNNTNRGADLSRGDRIRIYKNGGQSSSSLRDPYPETAVSNAQATWQVRLSASGGAKANPGNGRAPLRIGTRNPNDNVFFKGWIGQVAIYNKELTSSKIAAHYNAMKSGDYRNTVLSDSPVAFWTCEPGDSGLRDLTSNGKNLTQHGSW